MKNSLKVLIIILSLLFITTIIASAQPKNLNTPEGVVTRFMTHWAKQDYQHAWDLMTTYNVYNKDYKTFKNVLAMMHSRPERKKMLSNYEIIKIEGTADPLKKIVFIQLKNETTVEKSYFRVHKEKNHWRIHSFGPG